MTGNLYTLRYKQGNNVVTTSFIEASSLEMAERVGQHYVNQIMNSRYIKVEKAIVATEADLPYEPPVQRLRRVEPDTEDSGPMRPKVQAKPPTPMNSTLEVPGESPLSYEESRAREKELLDDEALARREAEEAEEREDAAARRRKADEAESADPPKVDPTATTDPTTPPALTRAQRRAQANNS